MATTYRKNNIPAFVEATYANLIRAIAEQKFTTAIFAYLTDKGMFCFVEADGTIHIIKGMNWQIQNVTTLPSPSDGSTEILYVMDDDIYTFNGTEYVLSYQKAMDAIDLINENLTDLTDRVGTLETDSADMKSDIESLDNSLKMLIGI